MGYFLSTLGYTMAIHLVQQLSSGLEFSFNYFLSMAYFWVD
jgi:hypothetical protein